MPRLREEGSPFEELAHVTDMTGGMDLSQHSSLLSARQAVLLANWRISREGNLETRPGYRTFVVGPGVIQGGERIYLRNVPPFTLIAAETAGDADVYKPSDGGVLGAAVSNQPDPGTDVYFTYDHTIVAVFDGVNRPQKSTDGVTWSDLGIDTPPAPTLNVIAGGSLIDGNTYEVVITWRDNETGIVHESAPSPAVTATTSTGNQTIRVNRPGAPAGQSIDEWIIYARNVTAGESIPRRAAIVPLGTTFFDLTENTWFPNGAEAPFGNLPPPLPFRFATVWNGRWWAIDGTTLYFSSLFNGQAWPGLNTITIPFERGDEGTALLPYGDTLIIFGHTSIVLVIGETAVDFTVRVIPHITGGALGPKAATVAEGSVIHASVGGVHAFDGASDTIISDEISPVWETMVRTTTAEEQNRISLIHDVHNRELRVSTPLVPDPGVGGLIPFETGAGEWILDLTRTRTRGVPAWSFTPHDTRGYIYWGGEEPTRANQGRLQRFHPVISRVFDENVGTQEEDVLGNPINLTAVYEGPTFARLRWARGITLRGEIEGRTGTLGIEFFSNERGTGVQHINFSQDGAAVCGEAICGSAFLAGSALRNFVLTLPLDADSFAYNIKAFYSGSQVFRWFTYTFGTVSEPVPRDIV